MRHRGDTAAAAKTLRLRRRAERYHLRWVDQDQRGCFGRDATMRDAETSRRHQDIAETLSYRGDIPTTAETSRRHRGLGEDIAHLRETSRLATSAKSRRYRDCGNIANEAEIPRRHRDFSTDIEASAERSPPSGRPRLTWPSNTDPSELRGPASGIDTDFSTLTPRWTFKPVELKIEFADGLGSAGACFIS